MSIITYIRTKLAAMLAGAANVVRPQDGPGPWRPEK